MGGISLQGLKITKVERLSTTLYRAPRPDRALAFTLAALSDVQGTWFRPRCPARRLPGTRSVVPRSD